jgi:integrase
MGHQSPHYLKLKGKTYYFSRRVPKALQKHSNCSRIEICLHTAYESKALKQASLLAQELDDQWSILRRRERNDRIAGIFGSLVSNEVQTISQQSRGPLLSEALETYLSLKGAGRSMTFETGARRSIGYLLEVTECKPIDAYQRKDANALREYLKERGLAKESVARNLTNVRAVINFVLRESGLQPNTAFSGIYLGEDKVPKRRYVPTTDELRKLQYLCQEYDDEPRWILGLISDTGLRLSEAIGLSKEDVCLSSAIPHISLIPRPWRRLKTACSERKIPLVGTSFWSAERAYNDNEGELLFPRYCTGYRVFSNSASASLNKWLKRNINRDLVVHSLRHSMRDRLRDLECPVDLIDQVGGWRRQNVGSLYGKGYSLHVVSKFLEKIEVK